MKMRNKFRPLALDFALEERLVLSGASGLGMPAVQILQTPTSAANGQGQNPLSIDQAIAQTNQAYTNFATQYFQARASYFASLGTSNSTSSFAAFRLQTMQLVNTLNQQLDTIIANAGAKGGLAQQFVDARVGSNLNGSLGQQLTTIPAIDTNVMTTASFTQMSNNSIQAALIDSESYMLIDAGTVQLIQNGAFANLVPSRQTQPVQVDEQAILTQMNQAFANFANQYQQAVTTYLNALPPLGGTSTGTGTTTTGTGTGTTTTTTQTPAEAFSTFQSTVTTLVGTLDQQLTTIINNNLNMLGLGGQGVAADQFIHARIGSDVPGSLKQVLLANPAVDDNNNTAVSFILNGQNALLNALNATGSYTQLYFGELESFGLITLNTGNTNGNTNGNTVGVMAVVPTGSDSSSNDLIGSIRSTRIRP